MAESDDSMTRTDLSLGLSTEKEAVVSTQPTEPFWTENLLFAGHDPVQDLGFWLHLGTVPNDWTMWEDRVLLYLPGNEGVLSMWAYHRTPADRRPAGSNLAFRCIEPFRRWKATFDGYAQHVAQADMEAGLAPDSLRKRLVIDLDIVCVTPVWDAQTAARGRHGKGDMAHQSWAKEHYEQLWRATGTIQVDNRTIPFDGAGWRDHSRGPRGGDTADPWGGHVIVGALMPDNSSAIFSRYWRPDGVINLEGALIGAADSSADFAEVLDAPRLVELVTGEERMTARLSGPKGTVDLRLDSRRFIWTSMQKRLAVGRDLSGPGLMYVLNFGQCEWNGQTGIFYMERSDPLNAPAPHLHAPKG